MFCTYDLCNDTLVSCNKPKVDYNSYTLHDRLFPPFNATIRYY